MSKTLLSILVRAGRLGAFRAGGPVRSARNAPGFRNRRLRRPPCRSTLPNSEARSSSSRPSSKTPCGKAPAAPCSALPGAPSWRTTGPSFPRKPACIASVSSRPSDRRPYSRDELDRRPTRRPWSGWRGLKEGMRQAVAEHGSLLGQLKPSHRLAVIVHLYNGVGDPRRPLSLPVDLQDRGGLRWVTTWKGRSPGKSWSGRFGSASSEPVPGKSEWRHASSSDGS